MKIWSDFKKRVKPILATLNVDFKKEAEQGVLLDGLERLITKISGQNVDNMNKYTENMTSFVTSIKDTFSGSTAGLTAGLTAGASTGFTAGFSTGSRVINLTKPVKVPTWSWNMSLETFIKHLTTWTEINDKIPKFMKFHNFIESLKSN